MSCRGCVVDGVASAGGSSIGLDVIWSLALIWFWWFTVLIWLSVQLYGRLAGFGFVVASFVFAYLVDRVAEHSIPFFWQGWGVLMVSAAVCVWYLKDGRIIGLGTPSKS